MALALPLASIFTCGDSSVTVTFCCATWIAMETSTRFDCPAASVKVGEPKDANPAQSPINVAAGWKSADRIGARRVGGYAGDGVACRIGDGDLGARNERARRVDDVAVQSPGFVPPQASAPVRGPLSHCRTPGERGANAQRQQKE